jgi:ADP-heptose:LPS heptosyltransferase
MGSILIVKLDHIGDLALALPACHALAVATQSGMLDLVVSPVNAGWHDVLPWVGELYTVQFPGYQAGRGKRFTRLATLWALFALAWRLRSRQYTEALDLRTVVQDWRGKLIARLSGAKNRIGGEGSGSNFLTHAVRNSGVHEAEIIGNRIEAYYGKLKDGTGPVTSIRRIRPQGNRRIVIHPGAGFASKMWPTEHWIELRKLLTRELPQLEVFWLGGEKERPLLAEMESTLREKDTFVVSGTIRETLQILADADLLVGLDSAAPHMAALVNTPAVTIFSEANEVPRWKAQGNNLVLHHPVECAPCHLRECKFTNHPCMKEIFPDAVMYAILGVVAIK